MEPLSQEEFTIAEYIILIDDSRSEIKESLDSVYSDSSPSMETVNN